MAMMVLLIIHVVPLHVIVLVVAVVVVVCCHRCCCGDARRTGRRWLVRWYRRYHRRYPGAGASAVVPSTTRDRGNSVTRRTKTTRMLMSSSSFLPAAGVGETAMLLMMLRRLSRGWPYHRPGDTIAVWKGQRGVESLWHVFTPQTTPRVYRTRGRRRRDAKERVDVGASNPNLRSKNMGGVEPSGHPAMLNRIGMTCARPCFHSVDPFGITKNSLFKS
jgi:hypothetical protein